jgi:hypothetical protein
LGLGYPIDTGGRPPATSGAAPAARGCLAFIRRLLLSAIIPLGVATGRVVMSATRAVREVSAALSVAVLALIVSPAVGGTTLTLPASGTGAVDGGGLAITNTEDSLGSGHPRPFAIEGIATGKNAGGLLGHSTKVGGIGVYGLNGGAGFAGYFLLNGVTAIFGNSALYAVNSGGSNSVNGPYGNAGFFEISNPHSTDTALFVETFGNGNAFHAETHGAETARRRGHPFDLG